MKFDASPSHLLFKDTISIQVRQFSKAIKASVIISTMCLQENNKKWPRDGQHFTLRAEISGAAP
jgi:hypothetical protein